MCIVRAHRETARARERGLEKWKMEIENEKWKWNNEIWKIETGNGMAPIGHRMEGQCHLSGK